MRSLPGVLAVTALLGGGCVAVLDFDLAEDGAASGSGASGSASTSSSPTSSDATGAAQGGGEPAGTGGTSASTSQGGAGGGDDCDGCRDDDGECALGTDLDQCGHDGATCEACEGGGECGVPACLADGCDLVAFEDGTACVGGACQDGVCVAGAEDCTDGVDNDDNRLIDCEDTDACGTVAGCIPTAPDGWLGPFAAYDAAGEVQCPGVWPDSVTVLHRDLDDSAFDCGTCSCDTNCTVHVTTYTDKTCDMLQNGFDVSQDECVSAFDFSVDSVRVTGSDSDCAPVVTGRDSTAAVWTTTVTLCGAPSFGEGCGDGQCASRPPPLGDDVHVCIAKENGGACPASGFTVARPAFAGPAPLDGRTCVDCTCEAPQGGCMGAIGVFTDAACTMCQSTPGSCTDLGLGCIDVSSAPAEVHASYAPTKQCTPSGGVESGSVSEPDPWAICCID